MGYIRHDAIIVTDWNEDRLNAARDKAMELGLIVSEIVSSETNGYVSFLIAPDGSKEGWDTSEEHETRRDKWKQWIKTEEQFHTDWVHINYGGEEPENTHIEEHNGL